MVMWVVWLIIAILLAIIEILTLTFFLLWLAIGSFSASVIAMIWPEFISLQILVAIIVSFLLTFFAHPFVKKNMQGSKGFKDPIDHLEGKTGEVVEFISKGKVGIVKIGSESWSAQAIEDIDPGEEIIVVSRQSTILQVTKKTKE